MSQKAIPNAAALAQGLLDADCLNDYDVSPVASNRPGKAEFSVDDGDFIYEVTVHRVQRDEPVALPSHSLAELLDAEDELWEMTRRD